jgi:peptidoglycan/xylan/chitin deacetylase (PgdA/CDA1 family)
MKDEAVQVARRALKGVAALALHYSGARDVISSVQRRAVGGVRVLILSYHRVVSDEQLVADGGLPTLQITSSTFANHLDVLAETHDIVRLDHALEVLAGRQKARRDLAVITFDDGYRDVFHHAFPVLKEKKAPAIAYVPSGFVSTNRRLAHDRLWAALEHIERRALSPRSLGVGGAFENLLLRACEGSATPNRVLERLLSGNQTAMLYDLCDALEERLGLSGATFSSGQLPVTWEMLREMAAHGVETGAHTAEHTVLTNQPLVEARREIAQCKSSLERGTGRPVRHFAYCNGWYSAGVAQALRAEGFVSAVTTEDIPNMPGVDPYALKRKVLWQRSSSGILGGWSRALASCQFNDTFGMLALQKPVLGAKATFFGDGRQSEITEAAHG